MSPNVPPMVVEYMAQLLRVWMPDGNVRPSRVIEVALYNPDGFRGYFKCDTAKAKDFILGQSVGFLRDGDLGVDGRIVEDADYRSGCIHLDSVMAVAVGDEVLPSGLVGATPDRIVVKWKSGGFDAQYVTSAEEILRRADDLRREAVGK